MRTIEQEQEQTVSTVGQEQERSASDAAARMVRLASRMTAGGELSDAERSDLDTCERSGLAILASDADTVATLDRHATAAAARMAAQYGDRLADVSSLAWQYAAVRVATDPTADRGKVLAMSVRDAVRAAVRAMRESRSGQTVTDDGPKVATFADWTDDARVTRAQRYTAGDLAASGRAAELADAILVSRQSCAMARADQIGAIGGVVTDAELRGTSPSAESAFLRESERYVLAAAMLATFGTDGLASLDNAYREERRARRSDKRSGHRRGDVKRTRYVAWSKVDAGQDATTTRRSVRLTAGRAVAAAQDALASQTVTAARMPRPVAKVLPSGPRLDPTILGWSPTAEQSEDAKVAKRKRLAKVQAAADDSAERVIPRRAPMTFDKLGGGGGTPWTAERSLRAYFGWFASLTD